MCQKERHAEARLVGVRRDCSGLRGVERAGVGRGEVRGRTDGFAMTGWRVRVVVATLTMDMKSIDGGRRGRDLREHV